MKNSILNICFWFVVLSVKAQHVQKYIEEAVENNPEIQSLELRYQIADEKVNEAAWIPNTEISAGYFVSEPETRVGAQRVRIGVKQMLPWFGTITARENYATSIADSEYVEIVIAKRKLALSVSRSYYELFLIRSKQGILEQNIQLLQTYERLALTSVQVGKASAVDVLRLQIRQNELQQQIEILEEAFISERAAFNILRNREENSAVEIVALLEIPNEDFGIDTEKLALNPELLKYDKLYESVVKSELLNQRESAPAIGFG
ncbi:MAG: TolC family protein, partial [Maribacter dokdonensis]